MSESLSDPGPNEIHPPRRPRLRRSSRVRLLAAVRFGAGIAQVVGVLVNLLREP